MSENNTTLNQAPSTSQEDSVAQNQETLSELLSGGIIQREVNSYRSYLSAQSAACEHSAKPRWIVMGENGWYWVVAPVDAERLITAGYELAQ